MIRSVQSLPSFICPGCGWVLYTESTPNVILLTGRVTVQCANHECPEFGNRSTVILPTLKATPIKK